MNLTLAQGEWLGLLGPNGAGKTTLVRAIAGRVALDAGSITLFGHDVQQRGRSRVHEQLGVVPQDIALYPRLTAIENLSVFGSLAGVRHDTINDRIDWALTFTGLRERAHQLVQTFSGGMKRRLNIAAGVMHQPQVILLDEPTVGVDPQSRERIWQMLNELRQQGASLLLTSHQLDEVERMCERIVIIDHGKVIAAGSVAQLVEQTVGRGRVVMFELDRPLDAADADAPLAVSHASPASATATVDNVAANLPGLLQQLAERGYEVRDLSVQSPSLQDVFIHLTGRELRE
ncbi:MAG: ATP-binding cassette domain-containing protein [Phycisphaerales bacterium]